jgi:hypothetical protein
MAVVVAAAVAVATELLLFVLLLFVLARPKRRESLPRFTLPLATIPRPADVPSCALAVAISSIRRSLEMVSR